MNEHQAWNGDMSRWFPDEIEISLEEASDSAEHNILLDDEIAKAVSRGERLPTIRVWRHLPVQGLVVSRRDVAGERGASAMEAMTRRNWPIFVRPTGGTAVPHGEGVLNLSMLFPRTREKATTDGYYRLLCGGIIEWLSELGLAGSTGDIPGSYCDGNYNVIVDGKKLVGTAQAWRGGLAGMASRHPGYILAHACIMIDVDLVAAMGAINTFYEAVDDTYRVQPETSTTLVERLREHDIASLYTSTQAKDSLASFLGRYYAQLGISIHQGAVPD